MGDSLAAPSSTNIVTANKSVPNFNMIKYITQTFSIYYLTETSSLPLPEREMHSHAIPPLGNTLCSHLLYLCDSEGLRNVTVS